MSADGASFVALGDKAVFVKAQIRRDAAGRIIQPAIYSTRNHQRMVQDR